MRWLKSIDTAGLNKTTDKVDEGCVLRDIILCINSGLAPSQKVDKVEVHLRIV